MVGPHEPGDGNDRPHLDPGQLEGSCGAHRAGAGDEEVVHDDDRRPKSGAGHDVTVSSRAEARRRLWAGREYRCQANASSGRRRRAAPECVERVARSPRRTTAARGRHGHEREALARALVTHQASRMSAEPLPNRSRELVTRAAPGLERGGRLVGDERVVCSRARRQEKERDDWPEWATQPHPDREAAPTSRATWACRSVADAADGEQSPHGPCEPGRARHSDTAAPREVGLSGLEGSSGHAQGSYDEGARCAPQGRNKIPRRLAATLIPANPRRTRYAACPRRAGVRTPASSSRNMSTPWYSGVHDTTTCSQPG